MSKLNDLPNAPSYEYIEPKLGRVFNRDRTYNMDKITDRQIDILLETDQKYWSLKFKKKAMKKTEKKNKTEVLD